MKRISTVVIGLLLIIVTLVSGSGIVYLTMSAGSPAVLSIAPAVVNANVGESVVVAVNISGVRDLGEWVMSISWNPSIMELDQSSSDAVAEGPFLKSANSPTKFQFDPYVSGSGLLSGVSCYILQAKGVSGSGSLVQLRFKAIHEGTTSITINNANLYDFMGRIIIPPPSSNPGTVNVYSTSVLHSIAIVAFDCPTNVTIGDQVQLNVVVENNGTVSEKDMKVNLFIDGNLNQSQPVSELDVQSNVSCTFFWAPPHEGVYNLTVCAILPGQADNQDSRSCLVEVKGSAMYQITISFDPSVPDRILMGECIWLNATVQNLGTTEVTNVEASIYVDSESKQNVSVGEFASGSSMQVGYSWTPLSTGAHNITALVTCVADHEAICNQSTTYISVLAHAPSSSRVLIVSDDSGTTPVGYKRGTSLPEFEAALNKSARAFDVWVISTQGHPSLALLQQYCLVVWTCGDFNDYNNRVPCTTDANTLEKYLDQGGNILIEGQRVCWYRVYSIDSFSNNVLHATYIDSNEQTPLQVVDTTHPVTKGLPSNLSWSMEPLGCADGVAPVNGGQKVIIFGDTYQRGAVTVFDGAEKGIGSVVFCSFPLYWLPLDERNTLVVNSVNWLARFGIEIVGGRIVNAPVGSVYFVYTNPDETGASATFDAAAGAMVYSACLAPQRQGFVSNGHWFLLSGAINHNEINNSIIVIIGNTKCQQATEYYDSMNLTPVKSSENSTHYVLQDGNGRILAATTKTDVETGSQDLVVIQTFKDGDNTILIMYGFSWRGTWAAGMYFAERIAKNLTDYPNSYYVLRWKDILHDGVPQMSEIELICSG